MTTYVPPRNAKGEIPLDLSELEDELMDAAGLCRPTVSEEATEQMENGQMVWAGKHWLLVPLGAGVALALILIVFVSRSTMLTPSSQAPLPSTAPSSVPTLQPSPTQQPTAGPVLSAAVVAYSAPGGEVLGAVDSGKAYTFVARYGDDWVQSDVVDSGLVWLRRADLRLDPDDLVRLTRLPDLQPPPPTPTPTVYVPLPTPAPTLPPMQCIKTELGEACAYGLDPNDTIMVTEIAARTKAYNAPFQQAIWQTATALSQQRQGH